jgi:hypothetical protein
MAPELVKTDILLFPGNTPSTCGFHRSEGKLMERPQPLRLLYERRKGNMAGEGEILFPGRGSAVRLTSMTTSAG